MANNTHEHPGRKLTFTVSELARELSIGQNKAYELCHMQGFPAIQIGKRFIIPVEPLQDWLKQKGLERKTYDGI